MVAMEVHFQATNLYFTVYFTNRLTILTKLDRGKK